MNKEYWDKYYKEKHTDILKPSPFAVFCKSWLADNPIEDAFIVDIGCGNGRDMYYLGAIGYDQSSSAGNYKKISDVNLEHFDVVYARFVIHALTEEEEKQIYDQSSGYLMIETRSDKGVRPDETHERRLTNSDELIKKLEDNNFKIIYFVEGWGLAPHKDEDPVCVRVIAKKQL